MISPMIIDFHTHFGKEGNKVVDITKLNQHINNNNIKRAVAFSLNEQDLIASSLRILKISKKYKQIIPFLRFDPKKISKEMLENLLSLDFRGIKLHPRSQSFDPLDKKISWIFKMIQKHNKPILFHCKSYHFDPNSHPEKLLGLAKRHPSQVFVLGHFAGVNKKLFKEYVKHQNIYVETSVDSTPNAYREIVLDGSFDRLVFGSDFPFSFAEIELLKLKMANLPNDIVEKILYKNAQKILRLK